jgi:hypothetical protein
LRTVVVSAADRGYFNLLKGLVLSLKDFESSRALPVAVLDGGLDEEQRRWLDAAGVAIHAVDLAPLPPRADGRRVISPTQRLRPRLPDVIPGYDVYLYMDADLWVQTDDAVAVYLRGAGAGSMVVTPEVHTAFRAMYRVREFDLKLAAYERLLDKATARRLAPLPTINCGCFALKATAPHWRLWQRTLERIMARDDFFYGEQIALNHVLYDQGDAAPSLFLSAYFNWVCHQALPAVDHRSGRLCDPLPPFVPLGVVHLTNKTKNGEVVLHRTDGSRVRRSLRYRSGDY